MSCSCQRRHPEVLRFGTRPFFFPWICFRCLDKVKKMCSQMVVQRWVIYHGTKYWNHKKNKSKFVFEDSKENSREVAGWYPKISPKDKNPEMKRSADYGISRSLRSWHLKKLSWGIQLSSPLLPNFTFSLKRPKKERPFPPQRGPLHLNLWLSDLPTESIRDFF